jgi:MoaD family protein
MKVYGMKVQVKLFSYLRELADQKIISVKLDDRATIEKLLEKLIDTYGLEFEKEVFTKERELKVSIAVNNKGKRINDFLKDGDVISILSAIGAG